ncbi:MAG: 23S rRNA (adenine(2030)-N(6))-methyltransferase RlmJ [Rhodanobacter sp.]
MTSAHLYWVTPPVLTAMNYRHAYHAGNFADVLKHTVLLALIEALQAKPAPFCYIDTHAGNGNYALDSFEAKKTGEHKNGITRLHPAEKVPPLLQRWRASILGSTDNEGGLKHYPGSPLQVARLLRPEDSAQLCELHTEEACKLRDLFRGNPQVHVHHRDGYEALKALVPPQEKRGMVLIDPPYEAQDAEYKLIEQALKSALLRWPTGIYAVWYPIKLRSQVQPFLRRLQHSGVKRILRAELLVHPDDSPLRLNGSGMVILNAPWNLDEALREPLRSLASLLTQDQPTQWKLDWLLDEAGSQLNTPSPLPASRLPRQPGRR